MRYVALLRAINVGGHTVTMAKLREPFEALGFAAVETILASGNVAFVTQRGDPAKLERKIEAALERALGFEVATFLRTGAELAEIAARTPFPAAEVKKARSQVVGFLAQTLDARQRGLVGEFETPDDRFHVEGRELHWLAYVGQGQSKFNNARFERRLGVKVTFRGLPTVERLAKRYPPEAD